MSGRAHTRGKRPRSLRRSRRASNATCVSDGQQVETKCGRERVYVAARRTTRGHGAFRLDRDGRRGLFPNILVTKRWVLLDQKRWRRTSFILCFIFTDLKNSAEHWEEVLFRANGNLPFFLRVYLPNKVRITGCRFFSLATVLELGKKFWNRFFSLVCCF